MKVLVDLDSIIVSIEDAWYGENNRRFDDDLTIEKVTDWDVSKFSKGGRRVFEILREPDFFRTLKPLPGALDGMRRLAATPRVDLSIVSYAPTLASYSEKAGWVHEQLPWFPLPHLVLTGDKASVVGDVLFDDGPHNLLDYAARWPARLATIAYPYNAEARRQLGSRLFVAGDYRDTAEAWDNFTRWIKETTL